MALDKKTDLISSNLKNTLKESAEPIIIPGTKKKYMSKSKRSPKPSQKSKLTKLSYMIV